MDHNYTLEELFGMLRESLPHRTCRDYEVSDWCKSHGTCSECRDTLIDAIERKAEEEWQRGYDEGFASADDWYAEHADAMAEHGWVKLPVDADGEVIHIGDVVENLREDLEPRLHHTFTVYGIQYRAYEQECSLTQDGYPTILYRASEVRRHHPPTVEDVLREFVTEFNRDDSELCDGEIIERFAKRLRLAGDDE